MVLTEKRTRLVEIHGWRRLAIRPQGLALRRLADGTPTGAKNQETDERRERRDSRPDPDDGAEGDAPRQRREQRQARAAADHEGNGADAGEPTAE